MGLADLLRPEFIQIDGPPLSKEGIIRALVEPLATGGFIEGVSQVTRALMERERVMSTGVGEGVALPHAQCRAVKRFAVAIGRPKEPIDFQALDNMPVQLIFLIVGPEDRTGLMRILTRISRLLYTGNLQKKILKAPTPEAVIELVASEEAKLGCDSSSTFPDEPGSSS
ncbi:MAG: PTS sugar transporter subunit IIA [Candidatus Eisenbacteria sp.]|nr:PTS sugar transporter subunit IIA [Candidatus Eisenbacteria bacterium]